MKLQPVRGTHDILPDEFARRAEVVRIARETAACYGYREMAVPIFEFSEVFHRTLGETSDVVSKETYTFNDRGGESITLRPEFTAGIARAFISNGLKDQCPLRWFTTGPIFRYERPQKGRLRQFHQLDCELIGAAEPAADVEVIALGAHILERLGLKDRVSLEINTLGDAESRDAYRAALVTYFTGHEAGLSEDSKTRLVKNPLRILDSKDPGDREIVKNAPVFDDYLTSAAQAFFDAVRKGLDTLGIHYTRNPRLVRGLDYYCHTAFEFITTELGAQGTVLAGGRYDALIQGMGGAATPAVGWGAGIERLCELAMPDAPMLRPVAVIPRDAESEENALRMASALRHEGIPVEFALKGDAGKRMKRANKENARYAVFLSTATQSITVRDLDSGEESSYTPAEWRNVILSHYRKSGA